MFAMLLPLRTFQRNGLQLDKDLIFSELVQNVYVYRMAKSKKIDRSVFYELNFKVGKKCILMAAQKNGAKTVQL